MLENTGELRPLLADRFRRPALVVILVASGAVGLLALRYAGTSGPGAVDQAFGSLTQRTPHARTFGGIDTYLHALGDPAPSGAFVAVVVLSAAVLRRWNGVLLTIVGTGLAIVLTELVLKPLVDRRLDGTLAYPSGHATAVAAIAISAIVLVLGAHRPARLSNRVALWLLLVAATLASGIAVVAGGYHYFTDAVAGWGVGLATVLSVALALDSALKTKVGLVRSGKS